MLDLKKWERIVIGEIVLAVAVDASSKTTSHTNRLSHGLVLNDYRADKIYSFSDGTSIHTGPCELFYLPKGSSYKISSDVSGEGTGCLAINFECNISDKPFSLSFRNKEYVEKLFKTAIEEWTRGTPYCDLVIRRSLYDIILAAVKEQGRRYAPSVADKRIAPALELIRSRFNSGELSISELARACGITEAYLRRIFENKYGVSPKEYIIGMRMNYARQLLDSGELSIGQVASLCGYAEPTHFTREFTRRVGVSPGKYRTDKAKRQP